MREADPHSLFQEALQLQADLVEVMATLHRMPELAFQEHRTTAFLRKQVEGLGLEEIDLGLETGLLARLKGGRPGKVLAIRADIDGVPVGEKADHPVRSETEGQAHACGHDFHMTCALGAARLLVARQENLEGEVIFIFQPAEEITRGAQAMLDQGLMEKLPSPPEALFGLHASPHFLTGQVLSPRDYASAGKTNFLIRLRGTTGHSGSPHEYQDVIRAGAALVQGIQSLVGRENDPQKALVCTVHTLKSQGPDFFVTDRLDLTGTIRAFDQDLLDRTGDRVLDLAGRLAEAYGCEAEARLIPEVPAQVNHPRLRGPAQRACEKIFDQEAIFSGPPAFLGAEDFAVFGRVIPSHFYWLGTAFPGMDNPFHHQPAFRVNEEAIPYGVALLVQSVLEVMGDQA